MITSSYTSTGTSISSNYDYFQKQKRRRRRNEEQTYQQDICVNEQIQTQHHNHHSTGMRTTGIFAVTMMSIQVHIFITILIFLSVSYLPLIFTASAYQLSPIVAVAVVKYRTGTGVGTCTTTIRHSHSKHLPVILSVFSNKDSNKNKNKNIFRSHHPLQGWKETNGEWTWVEEDPNYIPLPTSTIVQSTTTTIESSSFISTTATATPKLPSGTYKPKQSLGQNYLKDPNTVAKIIRAFHSDATTHYDTNGKKKKTKKEDIILTDDEDVVDYIVELGPGAGALTDPLIVKYGSDTLHCIEIDVRSIELLRDKHPKLHIEHLDVLQINYPAILQRRRILKQQKQHAAATAATTTSMEHHQNDTNDKNIHIPSTPNQHNDHDEHALTVIGNLPYYITSQILFALADATHQGLIRTATITMQYEVGQRMLAHTCTKEYGILSVVFQIYCTTIIHHFKIPPTVFYPQPKVNSILLGLHFVTPYQLQHERLCGVHPSQLRRVVTATFQQRRKTIRNSIKSLLQDIYDNNTTQIEDILHLSPLPVPDAIQALAHCGNAFALQQTRLPHDWSTKRPEEIHPAQFIELTRLIYSGIPQQYHSNTTSINMENDYDDDDDDKEQFDTNLLGTKVWRKLKHGE